MNQWIPICRADEIPELGARRVSRERGLDVAVFRTGAGHVYALLDRCPHKGGPLSEGLVFGESVACPLHNWTIQLRDGHATAPDDGCTPRFEVKVEDGLVYLDSDQLAHHATDLGRPAAGPCHAGNASVEVRIVHDNSRHLEENHSPSESGLR